MPPNEPGSCVELLQAMISFDTVTPHASGRADAERPLAEWLAAVAERWGLEPRWLPVEDAAPNLLLTRTAGPGLPWLVFDSHLDTVGVGGMTIDPFGGEVRDGRVWGRGASDTKGSGAAMLWAAREAILAGRLQTNVAILFSVGEEHCQIGAQSFANKDLETLGWRPAVVVVGEPTGMKVVAASNGFVRLRLATLGAAAHSSKPHLGHNAISDMARAILAIESEHIARLDARHPLTGAAAASINTIRGGVQHNVVPDRCEVQFDQRLTPGEDADAAVASVRAVLDRLSQETPGFRYEILDIEAAPPFANEASLAAAGGIATALETAGIASGVEGAPYTTNANFYPPAGLASVVLGPGDIAQAHTVDEWIAVEQLELGVRGYQALMESGSWRQSTDA